MERADVDRLTEVFRRLGAREPEQWAKSEVEEGIPQLGRFIFPREAWSRIASESDFSWIAAEVARAEANSGEPYAGVGLALKSLLVKGATETELTDLVRGMQAQFLFQLCYLLEDPNLQDEDIDGMNWGLFLLDEAGVPQEPLNGLHESLLETDPTGREMRPRAAG